MLGTGPLPGPRLRLPGRLSLGTPTGAGPLPREPRRFGSHREPQVAPQEPAASSLQEDALGPAPNQPTPEFPGTPALAWPGSRRPPAGFSCTHRGAALDAPAWDQPSPWGQRQRRDRRARGAHCGGAPMHRRVRARAPAPTPPSSHPHAHAGGARRAGSAADTSAGAQRIPGMRGRLLPPVLCRAPPASARPARTRPQTGPSHRAGGAEPR